MAAAPASTCRRSPSSGLGVILVLVGGLASAGGSDAPTDPVGVAALGRLQPDGEVVDVASPLGDRIASIVVKEGQEVALGDPLVHLNRNLLSAAAGGAEPGGPETAPRACPP